MAAGSDQLRTLLDKLDQLPPKQIEEVEDFVDFLTARVKKKAALDRLLSIAPSLEVEGTEPLSEEEIVAEVKAARKERRSREQ